MHILAGEGERACVCARVSVYARGASGRRAAGMAEKRRGSPCSMLSLKAHAFSVEALIGAEKQQQLQKKRRKLAAEEAAVAVEDGGCSRGGEKGSPEGDEGNALPPPAGAAPGPARSCADLELSCSARGDAGESAPFHPTWRGASPPGPGSPHGRGEPELARVVGARERGVPARRRPFSHERTRRGCRGAKPAAAAARVDLAPQLVPPSRR